MRNRISINRLLAALLGVTMIVLLSAGSCDTSSNDKQTNKSNNAGNTAQEKWGDPNITNFEEYKLLKEVYELRDKSNLVMYAYLQGNDGSLRCYGRVVGYGIPYATQMTPQYTSSSNGATDPVREPNALFMPDSAEATWIRVIDETTGQTAVEYVEPRLIVSPFKKPCKPTDQ